MRFVDYDQSVKALSVLIEILGSLREAIEEPLNDQSLNSVVPEQIADLGL